MTTEKLQSSPAGLRRRTWVATGALALLAGVGAAGWLFRRPTDGSVVAEPAPGFWSAQWPAADGALVALAPYRGKPLLLNFWATWCGPCIEELPRINAFQEKNADQGWQVVGVAIDKPAAVQAFLTRLPLRFPSGVAGFAGLDLARALGNVSGSLPFSVVVSADGSVALRKLGALTESELAGLTGLK